MPPPSDADPEITHSDVNVYRDVKFTKRSIDTAMRELICQGNEGHHPNGYEVRTVGLDGYLKCTKCRREIKLYLPDLEEVNGSPLSQMRLPI